MRRAPLAVRAPGVMCPPAAMWTVALVAMAMVLCAACGGGGRDADGSSIPASTLTVFAAASLRTTFTQLGAEFEEAHPGTTVSFSFAGSADLLTQLQGGAPADLFASADTANMERAAADQLVAGRAVPFAANRLEIAVPLDNPAQIASFADLARPGTRLVTCAPEVPCGAATQRVAAAAGVSLQPVSEESSVTDVLNKVQTGEADAGLVYVSDVKAAVGKVKGVSFPEARRAVNEYPIAVLAGSRQPQLAEQFLALVTGPRGREVLAGAGFTVPRPQ